MWLFLVFGVLRVVAGQTTEKRLPDYHQSDYDAIFERAELIWYDSRYFKDAKLEFPFHNRTTRVANVTGYLLVDQTSSDLVGEVAVYKFMSNEYRYFPLQVGGNVCVEYAHNRCNIQGLLKNKSNLHTCPLKKGFYYAYNVVPDISLLPPFMPHGRYKAVGKIYYQKEFIVEGHAYGEIVGKPMKWP